MLYDTCTEVEVLELLVIAKYIWFLLCRAQWRSLLVGPFRVLRGESVVRSIYSGGSSGAMWLKLLFLLTTTTLAITAHYTEHRLLDELLAPSEPMSVTSRCAVVTWKVLWPSLPACCHRASFPVHGHRHVVNPVWTTSIPRSEGQSASDLTAVVATRLKNCH